MDRLLRDIQSELMPGREPAPALAEVAAAEEREGGPSPASDQQVRALTDVATHLLASMRELLAGYERVVGRSSPPPPRRRRAPSDPRDVTLAAGPFPSLRALREFEQAVSGLPGVREVAVQAYEGSDRAIIEVRLDHATAPSAATAPDHPIAPTAPTAPDHPSP